MEGTSQMAETESDTSGASHNSSSMENKRKQKPSGNKTRYAGSINTDSSSNSTLASNKNYGIKLIRFFIYNPEFGPKEGEEAKKILYFYDSDNTQEGDRTTESHEKLEQQIKHVGLTEAAIRFASIFSQCPGSCALGMHTQKTKSVYLEPEKDFFMVLTVTVPRTKRRKHSRTSELATSPTYEYAYSPDDVHENVLRAILLRAYDMFKLFTGGFQHQFINNCDAKIEDFKGNLKSFFRKYVNSTMLSVADKADLGCSLFGGVQFLTLESSAFLKVHSFIGRIEDEFRPNIEASLFLHQGNIVWSGLQQKETALLFQYINTSLLPSTVFASLSERNSSSASTYEPPTSRSPFAGHQGRFLTGIASAGSAADIKLPKIFVPPPSTFIREENMSFPGQEKRELKFREYHLIVYHAITSTVCLTIPSEIEITNGMMDRLDAHMGSRLTNMSADLLDVFGKGTFHLTTSASNPTITSPLTSQGALDQNLKDLGFSAPHPSSASMASIASIGDTSNNTNVRFIYYNGTNKAMKNTLSFLGAGKTGGNNVPSWSISHSGTEYQIADIDSSALRDEIHIIADMRSHFEKIGARW